MERLRGHGKLAAALVACALAAGGVAAGLLVADSGHDGAAPAATTGMWAPLVVTHPEVPIIGGGVAVDLDPTVERKDFATTLLSLPGTNRYQLSVFNTSDLGDIDAFQWYPPPGTRIIEVLGSTGGRCRLTGLEGYGGSQFPTVLLNPNILCDQLDMKAPSCLCRGDGGTVEISVETDRELTGAVADIRVRAARLAFDRIPQSPPAATTEPAATTGSSG